MSSQPAALLQSTMSTFRRFVLLAIVVAVLPATANAADSIYWGAESAGTIRAGNLDGSGTSTPFGGEGGPCGVAIDPTAGKIYWANFNSGGLRVANLDGSGTASTLFDLDAGSLCGVAVDPANNLIYWANFSTNEIRVGNLDGTGLASTLFTEAPGSAPSGVAIDPTAGTAGEIYWTNQFSDEVRVGNLDGSEIPSTLFGSEDNPIGVAIDAAADKLYWTDLNSGLVRVGNQDGSGTASTLFGGENGPGGVAIDPVVGKIYWDHLPRRRDPGREPGWLRNPLDPVRAPPGRAGPRGPSALRRAASGTGRHGRSGHLERRRRRAHVQ